MEKKILIGIGIMILLIGTCYAANNNEIFKAPNGLQAMGHNDFVDQKGHNILIEEYNDNNYNTWFKNDTDPEYLVEQYQNNHSFYFAADDDNDCYILEVVEKDGTKYIVGSWTPKGAGETEIIYNNLLEFNKLNQVTPIEV